MRKRRENKTDSYKKGNLNAIHERHANDRRFKYPVSA